MKRTKKRKKYNGYLDYLNELTEEKMEEVKTKKVLGYSGTTFEGDEVRIIGAVTKKFFIEKTSEVLNTSKNWVKERVGETGNKIEVDLANEKPNTLFILNVNKDILESYTDEKAARRTARAKERREAEVRYERQTRPGKDARRLKQIRKQKEDEQMEILTMDEKVNLDEMQNYLRDHNGLLFDDDGYTITDIEIDKYGNIVATTKHQGMIIRLDKNYLDRLHKRMRLVKFMQREKRSVEVLNWKIKEARNWYNSDDFQYAETGENGRSEYTKKEAEEIADEKEQIVKERLEAELFLVENEIERLKKIRQTLKHYDYEIGMYNFYYMKIRDDEGQEVEL